ncbi:MAG TPA: GNAT family N-acetyltransferase [Afifellaceae bacterium]|nr:GNAT family N-acetyltransferase [Afifellaceae bacterium]
MSHRIEIRPYAVADSEPVCALFAIVNRSIAPPHLKQVFEDYIARSIDEEIGRIGEYYAQRHGSFWVAKDGTDLVGMFGLERPDAESMELRRMYVSPDARRRGIGRELLRFAEDHARSLDIRQLHLSTSELQEAALSLYRKAGYDLVRTELADAASNKTIGGGIRRFHFVKVLSSRQPPE